MTHIFHTADVHLAGDHPERTDALETVLTLAEEANATAVTISGDLFHEPLDVDELRPTLRTDLFGDRDVEVVVIPGNHDRAGFRGDTYFGDACVPLLGEPFEQYEIDGGDCRITGVPFVDRPDEALFVSLIDREPFDGTEVLLLHCTLDVGISVEAAGNEAATAYFPVTPEELGTLGFDYILAGHFHQPRQERLSTGKFVYPGTPASTRRSETGPRRVARLDIDADELTFERIESHYYAHRTFHVLPGEESELFDSIGSWVRSGDAAGAEATVMVDGFHALDETDFHDRLLEVCGPATVDDATITARRLRAHPLYESFEDRLSDREWDGSTADAVRARTLAAFNRMRGEL